MTLRELREKSMKLPLTPGVYIMKDKSGSIIYIGKAKALKNRVSQYFGSDRNHAEKVRQMVMNVSDFDYILCESEFEALVLECSLIKLHKPKYNILLKDDKGYSYIRVSNDKWRKISFEMQRQDDGAEYLGPYMSAWYAKNAVDEADYAEKAKPLTREVYFVNPTTGAKITVKLEAMPAKIKEYRVNARKDEENNLMAHYLDNYWNAPYLTAAQYNVAVPQQGETDPELCQFIFDFLILSSNTGAPM